MTIFTVIFAGIFIIGAIALLVFTSDVFRENEAVVGLSILGICAIIGIAFGGGI